MSERAAPTECANCGASIPRGAKACPECGADERTGWRETSVYDNLDLPESAFEDETTPQSRRTSPNRINGLAWYWWAVGLVVLLAIAARFVL